MALRAAALASASGEAAAARGFLADAAGHPSLEPVLEHDLASIERHLAASSTDVVPDAAAPQGAPSEAGAPANGDDEALLGRVERFLARLERDS